MVEPITLSILTVVGIFCGVGISGTGLGLGIFNTYQNWKETRRRAEQERQREEQTRREREIIEFTVSFNARAPKPHFRTLALLMHLNKNQAVKGVASTIDIGSPPTTYSILLSTDFINISFKKSYRLYKCQCRMNQQSGSFNLRFSDIRERDWFLSGLDVISASELEGRVVRSFKNDTTTPLPSTSRTEINGTTPLQELFKKEQNRQDQERQDQEKQKENQLRKRFTAYEDDESEEFRPIQYNY